MNFIHSTLAALCLTDQEPLRTENGTRGRIGREAKRRRRWRWYTWTHYRLKRQIHRFIAQAANDVGQKRQKRRDKRLLTVQYSPEHPGDGPVDPPSKNIDLNSTTTLPKRNLIHNNIQKYTGKFRIALAGVPCDLHPGSFIRMPLAMMSK